MQVEWSANKRDEKLRDKQPAWMDKNDSKFQVRIEDASRLRKLKQTEDEQEVDGVEFQQRLQQQYAKLQGSNQLFQWAQKQQESDQEDDPISALLKSNAQVFNRRTEVLQQNQLDFKRLKNFGNQHQSVLSSMSWHPSEDLLLTVGLDRKAKLISNNKVVQQIFLQDLPILKVLFINQGKQALLCGNRKHYYLYDLKDQKIQKLTGILGHLDESHLENVVASRSKYYCFGTQSGYLLIMDQNSKKLLFQLKMNGSCQAFQFSPCERYLYSVGNEAEIYQWDLTSRKCVQRVSDAGAFSSTALAVSPNGLLLATGSKMGSVNVYQIEDNLLQTNPFKTIMNLTTSITDVKFNHSSELLAMCSKWKKNAFKMVHIPSYTVFQNFPGVAPGVLKYSMCFDFHYKSKFIAMGNDEGKVHMFELSHF